MPQMDQGAVTLVIDLAKAFEREQLGLGNALRFLGASS